MNWMRVLLAIGALGALVWLCPSDEAERNERRRPSSLPRTEPAPELRAPPGLLSPRWPSVPPAAPERPAGNSVSGYVLGPDGHPVRPAHVKFVWDDHGKKRELHRWVEPDGGFEIVLDDPRAEGDLLAYVYEHRFAPAALTRVRAGASGLELRLGPPAAFELEVRDTRGRPVTVYHSPSFSWRLAGHPVRDDARGVGSHRLRFARSPVPFLVHVSAYGYESASFGPFEPAEVGERLVVEVQSLPRVRGRVVARGHPVPNVTVELWRLVPPAPEGAEAPPVQRWPMSAKTDEQGHFDLHTSRGGAHELSVFDRLHGGGRLGPIELDGLHDLDGLELELTTLPGAIEGRIHFPEGHGPEDVFLLASCGHGLRRPRSDGSYLLPGLPPGPCRIEITESWEGLGAEDEWIPHMEGRPPAPSWLAFHRLHEVEVRPGETTRLDLDLVRAPRCSLVGRIRVEGRSPGEEDDEGGEGTPIHLVSLAREGSPTQAFACLRAGAFTIGADEPGVYRLSAQLALVRFGNERWTVEDRITLSAGTNPWTLELASGSLRVLPAGDGRPLPDPLARWSGPGELGIRIEQPEREETSGARLFRVLPAGRVRVEARAHDGAAVVLECEIRAGETTEVRWPR